MLKVTAKLDKKHKLEAENILFETAPNNWMLSLNRRTKVLTLEGVFQTKSEAQNELSIFQEFLSKNNIAIEFDELNNNWREAYKEHFKPWNYGRYNFIPEWERTSHKTQNESLEIYIDPGMAFGTGTHETTRLCIELLIDTFDKKSSQRYSMLDVGCGSGILSILGKFLGFESILGIDNDHDAIGNSLHNLSLNFDKSEIHFAQKSIDSFEGTNYDCIVANIQADILIKNAQKLIQLLNTNGRLFLSGILNYEARDVGKAFEKLLHERGLTFTEYTKTYKEWCAISYETD